MSEQSKGTGDSTMGQQEKVARALAAAQTAYTEVLNEGAGRVSDEYKKACAKYGDAVQSINSELVEEITKAYDALVGDMKSIWHDEEGQSQVLGAWNRYQESVATCQPDTGANSQAQEAYKNFVGDLNNVSEQDASKRYNDAYAKLVGDLNTIYSPEEKAANVGAAYDDYVSTLNDTLGSNVTKTGSACQKHHDALNQAGERCGAQDRFGSAVREFVESLQSLSSAVQKNYTDAADAANRAFTQG